MKNKRIHFLLCALLGAALLLGACGGPAAPESPAVTAAPDATEAPTEAPAPQTDPLPEGAVAVSTVDEFLAALAPNTCIVLQEGEYDLSRAASYGAEDVKGNYSWELIPGGCQLVISRLSGLRLLAQGEVSILAQPRFAEVLLFRDCWDLRLEGLTLGHLQEPGTCAAGVLTFDACEDLLVENCRLFGCGSMGITARSCHSLRVSNSRIDSCSCGAVQADSCRDLRLEDCEICDCGLSQDSYCYSLIDAQRCEGFALVNCRISGNRAQQLLRNYWSDQVVMLGCQVEQNRALSSVFQLLGRSITVDKCSFQMHSSDRYYPSGDILFAKTPEGEDLISFDLDHMELERAEYEGPKEAEKQEPPLPGESRELTVETVDQLLDAIAPNTTITLLPGTYDLSKARSYGGPGGDWYSWEEVFDGFSLKIRGVTGLSIVGVGREEVLIEATPRYAAIFGFEDCGDLTLNGFTAGHSQAPGYCTGNVLDFDECRNVSVKNCGLFGCGVIGIYAVSCQGLTADGTEIYECSYAAASIDRCTDVHFQGCLIHDCDDGRNYIFLTESSMTWNAETLEEGTHLFDDDRYQGTESPAW